MMQLKSAVTAGVLACGLVGASAAAQRTAESPVERMPAALETQFALSALPATMRDKATVYLLDPATGYHVARQGTSGVACLVERTAWEQAEYRDIYNPLCYDAEGAKTYLKVIMDAAVLRGRGTSPSALKTKIERRYREKEYRTPAKPGVSYMVAPMQRTWMPDGKVHTATMAHLMFYAPNLSAKDIGAVPESGMLYPIVFAEGVPEQTYMVQVLGEKETAKIVADQKDLLAGLCSYRPALCLAHH